MRDIIVAMRIVGLGLIAWGALSLISANCTKPGTGDDMRLPAHLFKPFDATELFLFEYHNVPHEIIYQLFDTIEGQTGIVKVLKFFEFEDTIDNVIFRVDKNGVILFYAGKSAVQHPPYPQPSVFFDYLAENPIELVEGEKLEIYVLNTTGSAIDTGFRVAGYSYSERRHPIGE